MVLLLGLVALPGFALTCAGLMLLFCEKFLVSRSEGAGMLLKPEAGHLATSRIIIRSHTRDWLAMHEHSPSRWRYWRDY